MLIVQIHVDVLHYLLVFERVKVGFVQVINLLNDAVEHAEHVTGIRGHATKTQQHRRFREQAGTLGRHFGYDVRLSASGWAVEHYGMLIGVLEVVSDLVYHR